MSGQRLDDALPYFRAAAEVAGLPTAGASPVRLAENDLWRTATGVVVRIARPGQDTAAAREVAVARWLADQEIPAVRPLPIDQPRDAAGRPATYWHELPRHRAGTAVDLAPLLRRLHDLPLPDGIALGTADPFVRLAERIDAARSLTDADRKFLHDRHAQLRDAWDRLPPGRPLCVVHGDAWGGNCAVTDDGRRILLDFERTSLGRPEWDLTSSAIGVDTTGALTPAEYRDFCAAYGQDVRAWPGYPTLRGIRELRMVTYAFQIADRNPAALPQAQHRLSCIRGHHGPRPWHWTAAA